MPIPIKDPIIVPAADSKTFDSTYVTRLLVASNSPTSGNFELRTAPFDSATGEILKNEERIEHINLWELVENVPSVAAAMQAVFAAVPDIHDYIDARNVINQEQETPAV